MMRALPLASFALAVAACGGGGDSGPYMIVTVNGRPAVHDVTSLKVTLSNGGTSRTDDLQTKAGSFPLTFSIEAPGRAGDLGIAVDAIDTDGNVVGHGETMTTVDLASAQVLLDSADFVVNTDYASDQYPDDDYEAHGFQVAATADGTWTVAYRDKCDSPCNMFARRFDKTGKAVSTKLAAGTNGFSVSTTLTTFPSTPAVAASGTNTIEVWDADDGAPTTPVIGIACRSLDAQGQGNATQVMVATEQTADVVSAAPLANGNFVLAWNSVLTTSVIRSAVVRPDCTVVSGAQSVSTGTASAREASVAATTALPGSTMYAWIDDSGASVHVRTASATNVFSSNDLQFLPKTATESIQSVRVAPLGTGFAVVLRWANDTSFDAPGRIELYRTNATGGVIGSAIPVTTHTGSDFDSSEAFGVATRADGVLMVVWHSCGVTGDGSGCGVFGRAFKSDGTAVGEEFTIPNTTAGDQTNPSVTGLDGAFAVVWKDNSGAPPDISGSAVRARIIYPVGATP